MKRKHTQKRSANRRGDNSAKYRGFSTWSLNALFGAKQSSKTQQKKTKLAEAKLLQRTTNK